MKEKINILLITLRYTKEELLTIIKDPAILLVFIIANVLYPIIYSIAYKGEQIKDVSVALVDDDNTYAGRKFASMLDATEGIKIKYKPSSMEDATDLFYKNEVHGVIVLPKGFEKDILSGKQSTISIYSDASYFLIYRQVYSSAMFAYMDYIEQIQLKNSMLKGNNYKKAKDFLKPVNFKTVDLYNPNASYGAFVMPPLLLVILQQTLLIGIGILGGTRKEILRYQCMQTVQSRRGGRLSFILGKALAYFITFMIMGAFILVWIHNWFAYPDKANFLEVLALYVPYIIANIFLGMTISVFFKRRENALLFMVFLSVPILFFSGATWPVEAIPAILHQISYIFPSSLMIPAYLRVRTMGAELHHVSFELYGMMIQIAVYFVLAYLAFGYVMKKIAKTQITANAS